MTNEQQNEQHALWNGRAGEAWVDEQAILDGMFAPFEHALVRAVADAGARQVLDVGCGTGSTTLAIAQLPEVHCTGADVSRPMLAVARRRASARTTFVEADAQRHAFAPFDMLVSRFGVMFFDDPVRAFANLHAAALPDATLHVLSWRSPVENAFMTTAERAAAPLLTLPARNAEGPGQFAFADRERVQRILREAGWSAVELAPIDAQCSFPAAALERYLLRLGPVGAALADVDAATRARVLEVVRAAFAPSLEQEQVRYTAACWTIRARR